MAKADRTGYDPIACTAPLTLNPKSVEGKRAWLDQHLVPHFGPQIVERAIYDKKKFNHHGLALIDDRPDVDTNDGQASWCHVVFDQAYNQGSASAHRINGWNDPALETVLAEACLRQACE